MTLRKISIRLGMNGGLYLGICLGVIISGFVALALHLVTIEKNYQIAVIAALIISAFLVSGLIIFIQNKNLSSCSDHLCVCRYRSSLYTLCRKCPLYEKDSPKTPEPDNPISE